MEEQLNLVQKLARIRSMSDVVSKSKKGFNYTYSDIKEILAKITAGMKKYNVSLVPMITPGTTQVSQNVVVDTKLTKAGDPYDKKTTEMLVQADMVFRWINDDNPEEYMDVPWVVVGSQGDPSQAIGSSLTYCTRYFLTNFFQIAQSDTDVDAYRSKQKEAEAAEDEAIASGIVKAFDVEVREFLAQHPEKKEEVKTLLSKFAKNGNYLTIKNPNTAASMTTEFRKQFKEAK